jgi:penicillin-insensitive murein DD-endopeptidase
MFACTSASAGVDDGASDGSALGPVRIVGSEAAGCIAGAVELPPEGLGFATIHASRSFFWGAPSTIERVEELGERAHAAGLPELYVGDISRPRGGPIPGGHASHMLGLDVDIWLDLRPKPALSATERDTVAVPPVVTADGRSVDRAVWSPDHVLLLRISAELPDVDRIFVHPAIKQELCRVVGADRSWLRLIRPWWGHTQHMHIRFRCPADQPECVRGPPPPSGDGCDATLAWWFEQQVAPPGSKPRPPPQLPDACAAIMEDTMGDGAAARR